MRCERSELSIPANTTGDVASTSAARRPLRDTWRGTALNVCVMAVATGLVATLALPGYAIDPVANAGGLDAATAQAELRAAGAQELDIEATTAQTVVRDVFTATSMEELEAARAAEAAAVAAAAAAERRAEIAAAPPPRAPRTAGRPSATTSPTRPTRASASTESSRSVSSTSVPRTASAAPTPRASTARASCSSSTPSSASRCRTPWSGRTRWAPAYRAPTRLPATS